MSLLLLIEIDKITLDHKISRSKSGTNAIVNILPCCLECNYDKKDKDYLVYLRERQAERKLPSKKCLHDLELLKNIG